MNKQEYYELLKQNHFVDKIEAAKDDQEVFKDREYKATGGYDEKLCKYKTELTDEELDRAIQLKQLARLNTISYILTFFTVLVILGIIGRLML